MCPQILLFFDIDCNLSCPIILGRPFLRTIGAIIDMKEGNIRFQFPLKKGMEHFPRKKFKLCYEISTTKCGTSALKSDFCFDEKSIQCPYDYDFATRANDSDKPTTMHFNNTYITTLDILNSPEFHAFQMAILMSFQENQHAGGVNQQPHDNGPIIEELVDNSDHFSVD